MSVHTGLTTAFGIALCCNLLMADDKIVCRVDGRPLTCKELTQVSYDDAMQIIEKSKFPPPRPEDFDGSFIPPSEEAFKPTETSTLREYYLHCMSGVLQQVLFSLTVDELLAERPDLLEAVRNCESRRKYLAEFGSLLAAVRALRLGGLEGKTTDVDLLAQFKMSYPESKVDSNHLQRIRANKPAQRLVSLACFSSGEAEPPLWIQHEFHRVTLSVLNLRYLQLHQDELVASLSVELGRCRVFVAIDCGSNDGPVLNELFELVVSPKGELAEAGILEVVDILGALGSPSGFEDYSGSLENARITYPGIPKKVEFRTSNRMEPVVRKPASWVWPSAIAGGEIQIHKSVIREQSLKVFVEPALKRALKRVVVEAPFSIPNYAVLSLRLESGSYDKTLMGIPLPDGLKDVKTILADFSP